MVRDRRTGRKFEKCPSQLVEEFFDGDMRKVRRWWMTPNPLLGGWAPHHMVMLGERHQAKLEKFIRTQLADNKPTK
jgi:hypothetical protein